MLWYDEDALEERYDWLAHYYPRFNRVYDFFSNGISRPFWLLLGLVWVVTLGLGLNLLLKPEADWTEQIYPFESNLVAAVAPPPAKPTGSSSGYALEGPPSISVARITEVLRQYNSPATGSAQALYDLGRKYGIDPAFALAFFIHESSAGTKGVATVTRSIGNIRQTTNSGFEGYQGFRKYPTWEAGMEDWYKLIKNIYIQSRGLKTVDAIVPVYAPSADRNDPPSYIRQVKSLVDSWRGQPA